MEEINIFKVGGGARFYFFLSKNLFWPTFLFITFLSAIQVLVWYKNLTYFFAEYDRLETPLHRLSENPILGIKHVSK